MKQICENCGSVIERSALAFRLKIEMFADPSPPEFSEGEMSGRDFKAEIEELIAEMAGMDPSESEDEVHEAYLFTLCSRCRQRIHRDLKARQLPFEVFREPEA